MQNAADLGGGGGHFINVRNTHVCYIKFDFVRIFYKVRDIGTKYVTYWYQFFTCCEELVPILHSVKCELCGSTVLAAVVSVAQSVANSRSYFKNTYHDRE